MLKQTHDLTPRVHHHLISIHELIQLTHHFDQVQIDYMVLKGIPLNQLLYGNHMIRGSRDIDILFHFKDIPIVHQYLLERGYQFQSPLSIFQWLQKALFLNQYIDEILYWHPQKKVYLDIKWQTSSLNALGMSWCQLNHYDLITISGTNIKTLKPAENFYYLCTHAAKHHWEYRQWLDDLYVFTQKIAFCWQSTVSLAQKTEAIRPLLEASILLQDYYEVPLPPIPHSYLDKIIVKLRFSIIRTAWFKKIPQDTKCQKYLSAMLSLLLYPRLSQKHHYLKRLLLVRTASLEQINHVMSPKAYKIILRSFYPIRTKKNMKYITFWHMSRTSKKMFVMNFFLGGVANIGIQFLSYKRLSGYFGQSCKMLTASTLISQEQMQQALVIKRSISLMSRYTPWHSNCLCQALVAKFWCARYKLPYLLFIGLAKNGHLPIQEAHAWITTGPITISGGDGLETHHVIGTYSNVL